MDYDPPTTAILLVDPYNDFISEGGKLWPRVKAVAEEVRLLDHLRKVISTARARGFKIIFVPHHRWEPGDVVALEHWGSSGFANTDLDLQLEQHGIRRIVLIGMIANTYLESTGRFGMELGYHVTLVKDATAAFSQEAMHAAHAINGPTYAHAIVTTEEPIPQLSA